MLLWRSAHIFIPLPYEETAKFVDFVCGIAAIASCAEPAVDV